MTATAASKPASHLRYLPQEIPLPRNVAVKDLDWMTFAWIVKLPTTDRGASYTQIILGPGMLIESHSSPSNLINPFYPACGEGVRHSVQFRELADHNLLNRAIYRTESMGWDGYEMESELLMCDFSDNPLCDQFAFKERTREGHLVETLGDVVDTHPNEIESIVAHIATMRLRKSLGM